MVLCADLVADGKAELYLKVYTAQIYALILKEVQMALPLTWGGKTGRIFSCC